MRSRLIQIAGLSLLLASLGAHAASITLVATSQIADVDVGDLVTFDVMMDFSTDDNGLGDDVTLGGGFDIAFDSTALEFVSLNDAGLGDPAFSREPDVLPGLLQSWVFAEFNGLSGPALVGSVQFRVLATMGATTNVSTQATGGIGGPFVSGVEFFTLLNVDFNSVELTRTSTPDLIFADGFESGDTGGWEPRGD